MKINNKSRKIVANINNLKDLEMFVIQTQILGKHFKSVGDMVRFQCLEFIKIPKLSVSNFRKGLSKIYGIDNTAWCKNFWLMRGYTELEAEQNIKNFQTNNAVKFSKLRLLTPEKYKDISTTQAGYYIKQGYSEEEAKRLVTKRQTTNSIEAIAIRNGGDLDAAITTRQLITNKWIATLGDKTEVERDDINKRKGLTKAQMIEKYGETRASEIYKARAFSCSLEGLTQKYGKEIAEKMIQDRIAKSRAAMSYNFNGVSKVSILLFENLIKQNNLSIDECQYNTKEFLLRFGGKAYSYDFKYKNILIEFNGDYWHLNPIKYAENYVCSMRKLSAKEIWCRDAKKIKTAKDAGFEILTIWESDYIQNKVVTLQKCIQFINEKCKD